MKLLFDYPSTLVLETGISQRIIFRDQRGIQKAVVLASMQGSLFDADGEWIEYEIAIPGNGSPKEKKYIGYEFLDVVEFLNNRTSLWGSIKNWLDLKVLRK